MYNKEKEVEEIEERAARRRRRVPKSRSKMLLYEFFWRREFNLLIYVFIYDKNLLSTLSGILHKLCTKG
jgi:hypothetical protein